MCLSWSCWCSFLLLGKPLQFCRGRTTCDVTHMPAPSAIPVSYGGGYQSIGTSKKIEIPNMRVGVIIGKDGETIKYLQLQSGAKIQVTRDAEADLNSSFRMVELIGAPEQISKAEQLINDILAEAETGGSGIVAPRITRQAGSYNFVMRIPNNKLLYIERIV